MSWYGIEAPLAIREVYDPSPLPLSTNLQEFHPTVPRAAAQQLPTPEIAL